MDKEIYEYRKKHKKCKWCKFYRWNSLEAGHWITAYGECRLKDKVIYFEDLPTLCSHYKAKELNK
jgi:hypothetical protein